MPHALTTGRLAAVPPVLTAFLVVAFLIAALRASAPANAQSVDDVLGLLSGAEKAIDAGEEFGPADEFYLGRRLAARLVGDKPVLSPQDLRTRYVRAVGVSLALASNAPYLFDGYTFIVIDDSAINAFATPGGFVLITTGMLAFLRDEDELAMILGHEIGHVEMEHGMIAVRQSRESQATSAILGSVASIGLAQAGVSDWGLTDTVLDGVFDGIENGYSVDIESEADRRGMAIAHAVGYDAHAMLDLLARFKTYKGNYGGAGYPTQRGADARTFLQQSGIGKISRIPVRAARFNRFVNGGS